MCGIAGFVGVDASHRIALAFGLAIAIDDRGGHGAGFVTVNGRVHAGRKLGEWRTASDKFFRSAGDGDVALLHARYATCGNRTVDEVHPFAIKREGRTKLWGCHNGMIHNARESAKEHDRAYLIDSVELLELLADADREGIERLEGYGTLAWIDADDRQAVKLAMLTDDADLCIAAIESGGFVYASTWEIIQEGLRVAGLVARCTYKLETGKVYSIDTKRVAETGLRYTLTQQRRTISLGVGFWPRRDDDDWMKELEDRIARDDEDADFERETREHEIRARRRRWIHEQIVRDYYSDYRMDSCAWSEEEIEDMIFDLEDDELEEFVDWIERKEQRDENGADGDDSVLDLGSRQGDGKRALGETGE